MRRILPSRVRAAAHLLLASVLLAGCSEANTLPADTRLLAELDSGVDPRVDSAGVALEARLVSDLAAGERVVLARGTALLGRVTAVQPRGERLPWATALAFDSVRVAGRAHALPLELVRVEAPDGGEAAGGEPGSGGGLRGEVVGGRSGAALLSGVLQRAAGQAVVLGTGESPAALPAGTVLELRVTRRTELPAPDG